MAILSIKFIERIATFNVGMEGGRSMGKQGGERYRRKERKDLEVGVLKGWEVGEIEGNYTPMLNILQSK